MNSYERSLRAEVRRGKAILRKTRLQSVEGELSYIDGVDAISLVGTLTRENWAASRQAWPNYDRSDIPIHFVPGRPT